MSKEKVDIVVEYYAELKKRREERLAKLRQEFPDVSVEDILKKYRYVAPNNTAS